MPQVPHQLSTGAHINYKKRGLHLNNIWNPTLTKRWTAEWIFWISEQEA